MCNCNDEEPKCYHINMGCVTPIVANADAYYTKSEIDDKLDDIVTSGCCITPEEVDEKIDAATDGYATEEWVLEKNYLSDADLSNYALKSEIPTVPTKVSAFINDVPYLTEHQDLSNYALKSDLTPITSGLSALNDEVDDLSTAMENKADKSEIPSLSGYATEAYVQGYTYDKATIDAKVAGGGIFDPTQYYNKTQTNELLADKADTATTYSKVEVNNLLSNKVDATALNDYYNKTQSDALLDEKLDATAYTPTDLSNYDTKSEVNTKISNATSLVNDALTAHTANTTVHVTASEKSTWNGKQDVLSAGTGISITDNVISATGGGTSYTASSGISITNDEISTRIGNGLRYTSNGTLEVNSTNAIASGNTQVPLSYVVHSYINNNCVLKTQIWCGTQSEFDSITTKDPSVLYLIHS